MADAPYGLGGRKASGTAGMRSAPDGRSVSRRVDPRRDSGRRVVFRAVHARRDPRIVCRKAGARCLAVRRDSCAGCGRGDEPEDRARMTWGARHALPAHATAETSRALPRRPARPAPPWSPARLPRQTVRKRVRRPVRSLRSQLHPVPVPPAEVNWECDLERPTNWPRGSAPPLRCAPAGDRRPWATDPETADRF